MRRNDDLKNGLKLLFKETKAIGINVHKYPWVADLSILLSEHKCCYDFWHDVNYQHKLDRIPCCNNVYDILFNGDTHLLQWSKSVLGGDYWANLFKDMFYPKTPCPKINLLKELTLKDLHKRKKCMFDEIV